MGLVGQITYNGQQIVNFENKQSGTLPCSGKILTSDITFEVGLATAVCTIHGNAGYNITCTNGISTETVTAGDDDYAVVNITPSTEAETWTFTNAWNGKAVLQAITGGQSYNVNVWSDPIFGPGGEDAVIASALTYDGSETALTTLSYNTLTVTAAGSITMTGRNAGLVIRTTGDCTIIGSVVNLNASRTLSEEESLALSATYPQWMLNGTGGNGGAGFASRFSSGGSAMSGRYYGGGYGGGGAGGALTAFGLTNGGVGGSAAAVSTSTSEFIGGASPGTNGSVYSSWAAGNAGSYGGGGSGAAASHGDNFFSGAKGIGGKGGSGAGAAGSAGGGYGYMWAFGDGGGAGNYGGGVIIIYCGGTLNISGTVSVQGLAGGAGGHGDHRNGGDDGAAGGAGGGGRIYIGYHTDYINTGNIVYNSAGNGGTGTFYTVQL